MAVVVHLRHVDGIDLLAKFGLDAAARAAWQPRLVGEVAGRVEAERAVLNSLGMLIIAAFETVSKSTSCA